jgi:hypothetical protein
MLARVLTPRLGFASQQFLHCRPSILHPPQNHRRLFAFFHAAFLLSPFVPPSLAAAAAAAADAARAAAAQAQDDLLAAAEAAAAASQAADDLQRDAEDAEEAGMDNAAELRAAVVEARDAAAAAAETEAAARSREEAARDAVEVAEAARAAAEAGAAGGGGPGFDELGHPLAEGEAGYDDDEEGGSAAGDALGGGGALIKVRIFNLSRKQPMRELDPSALDTLVAIRGMVIRVSGPIPDMRAGYFRCVSCGFGVTVSACVVCARGVCGACVSCCLMPARSLRCDLYLPPGSLHVFHCALAHPFSPRASTPLGAHLRSLRPALCRSPLSPLPCIYLPSLRVQIDVDRGHLTEPASCTHCGAKKAFEMVHNRCTFIDKQ